MLVADLMDEGDTAGLIQIGADMVVSCLPARASTAVRMMISKSS